MAKMNLQTNIHLKEQPATDQVVYYATQLINRKSITPDDGGCNSWLIEQLTQLGFSCTEINTHGVKNFIATFGTRGRTIAFSGHTDVVPPGDMSLWKSSPFTATKIGRASCRERVYAPV